MDSVVIGLGEVGKPLLDILNMQQTAWGRDQPAAVPATYIDPRVDNMHICYSFCNSFIADTVGYIRKHGARLCIIHSTVVPGTTEAIAEQVEATVAYSPVRGRRGAMHRDLLRYKKFVAGTDGGGTRDAANYLRDAGFEVVEFPSCQGLELAKLLETTYSGLLIAWAQEMNRYRETVEDVYDLSYYEIVEFFAEVHYLPDFVFVPGHIGGHCILPNLELLERVATSPFIAAIRESNARLEPTKVRYEPLRHVRDARFQRLA